MRDRFYLWKANKGKCSWVGTGQPVLSILERSLVGLMPLLSIIVEECYTPHSALHCVVEYLDI
ncbi:MAG: hypothetical protein HCA25_10035 [Dolichospermum sp. DET50]|nr:hypothetical protein [Dolichospermum sp. DET66]MBS3037810.1 hypothetical protein [Dolichospermum sp. DET50]QSX69746.1 MAG: hypothetical protein EZY12_09260 [Dolichospermum sp. DET69]